MKLVQEGLGQFGDGTFRWWWWQKFYTKNVCFWKTVELPYYSVTSRDRRKSVTEVELTSQPNHNKSFLKWRFSWRAEPGKV